MRIISFNVEGIESAQINNFFKWLQSQDADIICLQDLRADQQKWNSYFSMKGYYSYCADNYSADLEKSSGVAIYSKFLPKAIISGIGIPTIDMEGRYIQADFNSVSISSLLIPGDVGTHNSDIKKYVFLNAYLIFLKKQCIKRREVITCGTFNIAYSSKDVGCYEDYKNMAGVLPYEQKWMKQLINNMGYIDCYREIEQSANQFSFWEKQVHRYQDLGWRIDYQIATKNLRSQVINADIYATEVFSRHAPIIVDYELDLLN